MAGRNTPVMEQHARAKRAHPDALIFFRLGDFYELFEEDALVASRVLDIALTSRNKGKPDEVPMAGVPHHAAHGYVARLLAAGFKVALCEQMADPAKTRGIVPREVVRVLTPGTLTQEDHLVASEHSFLCAVEVGRAGTGIALLDLSTGSLEAAAVPDLLGVLAELARAAPREVLLGGAPGVDPADVTGAEAAIQRLVTAVVRADAALGEREVAAALGTLHHEAVTAYPAVAVRAAARALRYARECHPLAALPEPRLGRWDPARALALDPAAQRHLELVRSSSGQPGTTLLEILDLTSTPAGARLLRRRLLAPLTDPARIRRRLDHVEAFVVHPRLRQAAREALAGVGDLERLATRATLGEASPRDLGALRDGLGAARRTVAVLGALEHADLFDVLGLALPVDTVDALGARLEAALVERPPVLASAGAVFRPGFDAQLDEQADLSRTGAERMVALEAELRAETGIATLKVRYTRVFGWYIEVSAAKAGKAPAAWRRKQTVATGERFTTDALDELADRIQAAEERHRERELGLLAELVADAGREAERLRALSARLARWDVAAALAEVAHRFDYVRPEVDEGVLTRIVDGRHPVVERLAAAGRFVPNDVTLEAEGERARPGSAPAPAASAPTAPSPERFWLVTGPNMAGKSTLLRQTALITILGQMGSFVPARAATLGVVDRVLSRVGASDDLARGDSTFMVEMRETAEILRTATARSLVILDEIGRGTSTFDGLSIAWAVAEHLLSVVRCRTLFATHYHELVALAEDGQGSACVSVGAREHGDEVVFLHRLGRGAINRSFGVAVARLAGLPESVLARARAVLAELERGQGVPGLVGAPAGGRGRHGGQLGLFATTAKLAEPEREVVETLRALELERLSPLDALALLVKLKGRL